MSGLRAGQPIAGLRSSGKGANRTILDCLFRPIGWEKRSFCRRGVAGAGSLPWSVCALPGAVPPAAAWKGVVVVTTENSAEHPPRRDFLLVATGCAAAVGGAATLWPVPSPMRPGASALACGAPLVGRLTPIAPG